MNLVLSKCLREASSTSLFSKKTAAGLILCGFRCLSQAIYHSKKSVSTSHETKNGAAKFLNHASNLAMLFFFMIIVNTLKVC